MNNIFMDSSTARVPGIDCAVAREAHGSELSVTVRPLPGETLMAMFSRLALVLKESEATLVHLMVFGSIPAGAAAMQAMRRLFGRIDWPVTWVEGASCGGGPIAGMQVCAFTGGEVQRVVLNGQVVGSVYADGAARHCRLGGLGQGRCLASPAHQTHQTLEQLQQALALAGFSLTDTVRTWFFLDDIVRWYGDFNRVRTQVYSGIKFHTGSLPASTGVAGRNPAGTALVAGARALQPANPATHAAAVASPLQCAASAYGSSFSRAMEISSAAGRRLFISGTASIALEGRTLWPGDARRQVGLTMGVVEAILHSRGFTLSDLTRATAYFKHPADLRTFSDWCAARDLRSLPVVTTHCDLCREDLLFELEADAMA